MNYIKLLRHKFWTLAFFVILISQTQEKPLHAQGTEILTLESARFSNVFSAQGFSAHWCDTAAYEKGEYDQIRPCKEPWGGSDIVRIDAVSGEETVLVSAKELLPEGSEKALSIASFEFSPTQSKLLVFTNTKRVWRRNTRGDYWIYDRTARQLRKLGANFPESTLMFAKFSPDEKHVAYVQSNNIYVEELRSGKVTALTASGGERYINGTFDWVYEEEFDLRDGFRWSPDGRSIAFWQLDTEGVAVHTMINNTDTFYPTVTQFKYPRAGTRNASARIGIASLEKPGEEHVCWLPIPRDPGEHYPVSLDWLQGDQAILVRQLNRLQNQMTYWIVPQQYVDLTPGTLGEDSRYAKYGHAIPWWTDSDEAWVDLHELHWLPGGRSFVTLSEKDGWRHLYYFDFTKQESLDPKLLTPGEFDVIDFAGFDYEKAQQKEPQGVYFYASPENATQKYLYYAAFDGSEVKRLTPQAQSGTHSYTISPDGKLAFHSYSSRTKPPVYELVRLPSYETVKVFENNEKLQKRLDNLRLGKTEFFNVTIPSKADDELSEPVSIDAWCIYPSEFDPEKTYPVLVHVYGEPAGQTVLDRWDGRHHLWHQMLAQKGYFIVSYDNRGTPAPKGRTWRKSAYRRVGTLGPSDQAAALRATLKQRPYLDEKRIGIWGWSGGGSMSLHAIFQYPELYKTAVAIAPVPDERYYDTIYQERYMGLPGENAEDYRNSSPISYAKQLKGNLLLVHGTGDDNTHYQTVELLFNELIRHEKQFSMMIYPNRTHGISEGPGTTRHLWKLVTDYILENI